ncbi:MAG TPA: nickel insertion protein [Phycisphaeraceae bacterium]
MAKPRDSLGNAPAGSKVVELAVNLDDATPELIGRVQEELLAAGALDVWTVPIGMKKQRPGVMLSLLCAPGQRAAMARRVLALTGSFGVRFRSWRRLVLDRRHVRVQTRWGPVRLKVGSLEGQVVSVKPELEDVRALARQRGVTLRRAMQAAQAAADRWLARREDRAS